MAALLQIGALLFFATLIGLIAFVSLLVHLDQKKLRRAARRMPCVRCGALLGDAAVALADELWQKHMGTLQARNPRVTLRVVRTLFAACPQCGARYRFDEKAEAFSPVAVALAFEEP